jgi:hypothetical protein
MNSRFEEINDSFFVYLMRNDRYISNVILV